MYRIGVINVEKQDYSKRIFQQMIEKKWELFTVNRDEVEVKLDALFIQESNVSKTCEQLVDMIYHKQSSLPIYVLLKNNEKEDNAITYLTLGAEVCFQYETRETVVILTIEKLLKSRNPEQEKRAITAEKREFVLIPENMSVILDGKREVPLTRLEYQILEVLWQRANNTVTYHDLSQIIWQEKNLDNPRYRISNCVCHLRKKLKVSKIQYIQTVRTVGYRLVI